MGFTILGIVLVLGVAVLQCYCFAWCCFQYRAAQASSYSRTTTTTIGGTTYSRSTAVNAGGVQSAVSVSYGGAPPPLPQPGLAFYGPSGAQMFDAQAQAQASGASPAQVFQEQQQMRAVAGV